MMNWTCCNQYFYVVVYNAGMLDMEFRMCPSCCTIYRRDPRVTNAWWSYWCRP